MKMLWFVNAAVLSIGVAAALPAAAQTKTARQVGLEVAARRGVSNPVCYATVFAKHARVVENANGARGWNAQSTPAYNAELRSRCGVDRLAIMRGENATGSRQRGSRLVVNTSAQPGNSAYAAGYRLATQRGYANKDCFARWYARNASPMPVTIPGATVQYAIWGRHHNRHDLWQECRISA